MARGTPEGPAEEQALQAAVDVFQLSLQALQSDLASGAPRSTIVADIQTLDTALTDLVRADVRFVQDVRHDAHGHDSGGGKEAVAAGAARGASRIARDALFATLGHHKKPGSGDGMPFGS